MSRFLLILFAGAIALSFPCVGVLVTRRHRLLLRRRLRRLICDSIRRMETATAYSDVCVQ